MIKKNNAMADAMALAKRAAEMSDAPILLLGETGVGKSSIARQVHAWTGRKGPFVLVDCGALPPGLIESHLFGHTKGAFTGAVSNQDGAFRQAEGGTIFLDEIGDLPIDMQTRLLRVVQDRAFRPVGGRADLKADVRIIAATHRDLDAEVKAGRFRSDLRFRLRTFPVVIPPLRERRDEIKGIVEGRLKERGWELEGGVLEVFEYAQWPGNVRELLSYVERAVIGGWHAEDAARELRGTETRPPVGGRAERLEAARTLKGWWSAAQLALACGASKATICRDLLVWVGEGVVTTKGEGSSKRYLVSSQSSHDTVETDTRGEDLVNENDHEPTPHPFLSSTPPSPIAGWPKPNGCISCGCPDCELSDAECAEEEELRRELEASGVDTSKTGGFR